MMVALTSFEDIKSAILRGESNWEQYGLVNVKPYDGYLLFGYQPKCQFKKPHEWNWFELNSRGHIYDATTGELVARPFSKFFNYGQVLPDADETILYASEKQDGSLGILYNHHGKWRISTRGNLQSESGTWATEHFNKLFSAYWDTHSHLHHYTLLFEIITKDNRIVVDYGNYEGLVLIGAIDTQTGDYASVGQLIYISSLIGFTTTNFQQPKTWDSLVEETKPRVNSEGWVVMSNKGKLYKLKTDEYVRLHQLRYGTSFWHVLEAVSSGTIDEYIGRTEDMFLGLVYQYKSEIETTVDTIAEMAHRWYNLADKTDAKTLGLWLDAHLHKSFHAYIFGIYKGWDLTEMTYKFLRADRYLLETLKRKGVV